MERSAGLGGWKSPKLVLFFSGTGGAKNEFHFADN